MIVAASRQAHQRAVNASIAALAYVLMIGLSVGDIVDNGRIVGTHNHIGALK